MRNEILHIVPHSELVKSIQNMAPEIGMGTTSDVAHFYCIFNEGYVPRNLSEDEVNYYLSNNYSYDRENASEFFHFLSKLEKDKYTYKEVVIWFEDTASSFMLLCIMCRFFVCRNVYVIWTNDLHKLAYRWAYKEAFNNRQLLPPIIQQKFASCCDLEEWHKPKFWILDKDRQLVEYSKESICEDILSECRTDKFIACARVVGHVCGKSDQKKRFDLSVYFDFILEMVAKGVLEAQQRVSQEDIDAIFSEDDFRGVEHVYAPNGVDITVMNIFAVKKISMP